MQYPMVAFALVILTIACSAGCVNPSSVPEESVRTPVPTALPTVESASVTVPVSEMALQLFDLPSEYILRDRSVMSSPEVTQLSRDLGWTGGYFVMFDRAGRIKTDQTRIRQAISIFPEQNMNKVFNLEKVALSDGQNPFSSPYEIPFPTIGDQSIAYRMTDTPEDGQVTYIVIFTKKNVFERITMAGTSTDYETLKDIVQTAEAKVR